MMEPQTSNKSERINLRLKTSAKRLIECTDGFEGKTVSHYILSSVLKSDEETVQAHEKMVLSEKNSRTFFDALASPVRFNRKLTQAFEEHDKCVVSK